MDHQTHFDPLKSFAGIERLAAKVYFRFSHLFFHHAELRDFWWQMAMDEEQHSATLLVCREVTNGLPPEEGLDSSVNQETAEQLERVIHSYLEQGTPSISVEDAFKVALELETSELNTIYSKLMQLGGGQLAETLDNLGVPIQCHRERLSTAIARFSNDPELQVAARDL